ncbi:porin [Planctobacterium marinum]|uniref:porin n=1 Tax=Planctobacterium marinum TaxID=1631968 RepID=UPI001E6594C5|nr:porin [Planctobacterium marinum]MCC2605003.1 porin [Planctobacterium marinum]
MPDIKPLPQTLFGSFMLLTCSCFAEEAELLDFYGKVNMTLQYADEGEGSFTELKSNSSRVGVKGEKELEDGLTVFYLLEWQVDLADLDDSDNIKSRNQYLGLKGSFGEVVVGRNDTVTKQLSKPMDTFSDYEADLKGLWKGENRVNDSLTYFSPSLNGFVVAATYVVEDASDKDDGTSIGVYYGDPKLKKSQIYAALTHDSKIKGYDVQRLVVAGKFDDWTLGAGLHQQEPSAGGESQSGATVNAEYRLHKWKLKSQYQTLEDDNSITLGADYKLGDSTKVFAWLTNRKLDSAEDKRWLSVGIEHKF